MSDNQVEIISNHNSRYHTAWADFGVSSSGFRTEVWGAVVVVGGETRERLSSADWRAGGALAQFRLMSGQLEVHHSALCTVPVSLNLCCRGPYPQPGHSPREALTLKPILLWQLHSSRSNAKRYCDVYTVTLYSCLFQQQGCVCAEPGEAGREKWHSGERGVRRERWREVTEEENKTN